MPTFRFTAIDGEGKSYSGVLEANSAAAVADRIHDQGRMLVHTTEVGRYRHIAEFFRANIDPERSVPKVAVARFTQQLSVMLIAGQDVDSALQYLLEITEHKKAKQVIDKVRNQVRGGKSLTVSLSEHPKVFSRLYVSMVRAGETSGQLAQSLQQISELLDREMKLTATVRSAMIYPAMLFVAAIGTIVMLLTYVLPQFTPVFAQAGAKLPAATQFFIDSGAFIHDFGLWLLLGCLLFAVAAQRLLAMAQPRLVFDRIILRVPVLGTLIRRTQAARMTRTLGTLLVSGVGLVGSLTIVRDVLSNRSAVEAVWTAANQVKSGGHLAAALRRADIFPIETIHLLQLGEQTGRLGEMSLRSADIHDDQVAQAVQTLVALLVPAVTIFMGVVVAAIVASLLVAMLSLNDLAV